jgi:hypothetical protein
VVRRLVAARRTVALTPAYAASLTDMTDTDPPSEKDSLPPPWLIVTGIIVALGVIFLLGVGTNRARIARRRAKRLGLRLTRRLILGLPISCESSSQLNR